MSFVSVVIISIAVVCIAVIKLSNNLRYNLLCLCVNKYIVKKYIY